jgi:hypothetical protein
VSIKFVVMKCDATRQLQRPVEVTETYDAAVAAVARHLEALRSCMVEATLWTSEWYAIMPIPGPE